MADKVVHEESKHRFALNFPDGGNNRYHAVCSLKHYSTLFIQMSQSWTIKK